MENRNMRIDIKIEGFTEAEDVMFLVDARVIKHHADTKEEHERRNIS
jgi:hypothetical protein